MPTRAFCDGCGGEIFRREAYLVINEFVPGGHDCEHDDEPQPMFHGHACLIDWATAKVANGDGIGPTATDTPKVPDAFRDLNLG